MAREASFGIADFGRRFVNESVVGCSVSVGSNRSCVYVVESFPVAESGCSFTVEKV